MSDDGIDVLGFLSQEDLTAELASAKALVAPSLGGESFGMVLTRAFACATPVVASDIPGYRDVMTPETSVAVPPDEPRALADAVSALLEDEPRREALGAAARQLAIDRYSWADIARRLDGIYDAARGVDKRGRCVRVRPAQPLVAGCARVPLPRRRRRPALVARAPTGTLVDRAFDLVNWAWIVVRDRSQPRLGAGCARSRGG